jgi:hypothetical protein
LSLDFQPLHQQIEDNAFEYALRTRTAIGNTRRLFGRAPIVPIEISVNVIAEDDRSAQRIVKYEYYKPTDLPEIRDVSYELSDYIGNLSVPGFTSKFRGMNYNVEDVTVGTRRSINCDFALYAVATNRLSYAQSIIGIDDIGTSDVNIGYGVWLSINGMPTGLRIDNWDEGGAHLKRYTVIVDANLDISNQLDPGRKGISRYYGDLISEKARELYNWIPEGRSHSFAHYSSINLTHGHDFESGRSLPLDFKEAIKIAETDGEKISESDKELVDLLRKHSSLIYPPTDEQEVVILFFELIRSDVIKGYRSLYVAGSSEVYDTALEYKIPISDNNRFPQDKMGLGKVIVQEYKAQRKEILDTSGLGMLEQYICADFKLTVGDFLKEISKSRTSKHPGIMDLLIVWDHTIPGSIDKTVYTYNAIPEVRRILHSTTHRLQLIREISTEIQVIVLKDVLRSLA